MGAGELLALVKTLLVEVGRLREENEALREDLKARKVESQALKDEIARLKGLPPRPPPQSSGMEKATDRSSARADDDPAPPPRRRGPTDWRSRIDRTIVVKAEAPEGSRFKGYEEIVVQDLMTRVETTLYRRERWVLPDGSTLIAPLAVKAVGGVGPHLHRLVLALHFQGQVTCERIVALLTGLGAPLSKRQVVRLLTAKLSLFHDEDERVLRAGLARSPFVTVDDTGARHAGKACYTLHVGSDRFANFRTGVGKSRLSFLSRLAGAQGPYVVDDVALGYMREAGMDQALVQAFAEPPVPIPPQIFPSREAWTAHLRALGLNATRAGASAARTASEAVLWAALQARGLLHRAVIVSDEAGQFRVGDHALCWVHAERLLYKLVPANDLQRNALEVARRMIWWLYRRLKDYKRDPCPNKAENLRAAFERIFNRRTRYAGLDHLLKRLLARKHELLRVLGRPEIPLNTNASENDIRAFVTKRKVSGGTVSQNGRLARDAMLGLAKTCAKLKIPFFDYLGSRLGIQGPQIPDLAELV